MDVNGQFHAPAALLQANESPVPIVLEVVWAPEPVWTRWRREKIPPCREWNTNRPARILVALSYPGSTWVE